MPKKKIDSTHSVNKLRISNKCPLSSALMLLSGRWKLVIIWNLQPAVVRFSELQRAIPAITKKMLTQQLRELEADGLVTRKVYAVVPPKVEYSLTKRSKSLLPVLKKLYAWGEENNIAAHIAGMESARRSA